MRIFHFSYIPNIPICQNNGELRKKGHLTRPRLTTSFFPLIFLLLIPFCRLQCSFWRGSHELLPLISSLAEMSFSSLKTPPLLKSIISIIFGKDPKVKQFTGFFHFSPFQTVSCYEKRSYPQHVDKLWIICGNKGKHAGIFYFFLILKMIWYIIEYRTLCILFK